MTYKNKRGVLALMILLPTVLVIPIILQGCAVPIPTPDFGDGTAAQKIGLDFTFIEDAPPKILEPGAEFQVGLKVENYGITTSGQICVTDTAIEAYGGISEDCEYFSVREASEERGRIIPRTEMIFFPLSGQSYRYVGISKQPISIIAHMKYNYVTEASPIICVKDPVKQTTLPCKTSEELRPETKAPLAITKVEKNLLRVADGQTRLSVKITLRKEFEGALQLPGSFVPNSESEGKIRIERINFGNYPLTCNVQGNIVEIATEKVIRCSGVVYTGDSVISHPLEIALSYVVDTAKIFYTEIE